MQNMKQENEQSWFWSSDNTDCWLLYYWKQNLLFRNWKLLRWSSPSTFFHWKSNNSLGNWFGFEHAWQGPLRGDRREHAWLLGEGVVLLRAGRAGFFLSFDLKVFEDRNGFIAAVSWSKKAFSLSRREVASTASLLRNGKNLASKPYFQGLSTILLTLILKTKFLVLC